MPKALVAYVHLSVPPSEHKDTVVACWGNTWSQRHHGTICMFLCIVLILFLFSLFLFFSNPDCNVCSKEKCTLWTSKHVSPTVGQPSAHHSPTCAFRQFHGKPACSIFSLWVLANVRESDCTLGVGLWEWVCVVWSYFYYFWFPIKSGLFQFNNIWKIDVNKDKHL